MTGRHDGWPVGPGQHELKTGLTIINHVLTAGSFSFDAPGPVAHSLSSGHGLGVQVNKTRAAVTRAFRVLRPQALGALSQRCSRRDSMRQPVTVTHVDGRETNQIALTRLLSRPVTVVHINP